MDVRQPLQNWNALGRIRTYSQQIMLTIYVFRRPFRVCGLDFLFPAQHGICCQVSTPFPTNRDLARDYHRAVSEGFPEFNKFY